MERKVLTKAPQFNDYFNNPALPTIPSITTHSYNIPPNITYAGNQPLFVPYTEGGGGSSISTFSTLITSTITGNTAVFDKITSFSTITVDATQGNLKVLGGIDLDGNILTTSGTDPYELLLNGIPIATTTNISSITDWSKFPAISTVNMELNDIINCGTLDMNGNNINNVNSMNGEDGFNLNLTASAGNNVVITGGVALEGTLGGGVGEVSVNSDGTVSFGLAGQLANVSTINGVAYLPYTGGGGASTSTISGVNTYMTAQETSFITAGGAVGLGGKVDIMATPGAGGVSGGNVSLTANGGTAPAGLYGKIELIAQPGTATVGETNITTGGYVNIQANSGSIISPTATSRIDLNAGGLNLYSGIASPITSVFGYTFVNALTGISLVAGTYSSAFQVPGTVYLYGESGVVLNSDVYTTAIYPYWNGLAPPADLSINGRTTISGTARVNINNANTISFDATGSGALTGVQTINGSAYPPTITAGVASLNSITGAVNLVAGTNVSISPASPTSQDITINATVPVSPPDPNPQFSTITVASGGSLDFTASTGVITNVSTINGVPYINPQSIIPYALNGTRAGAVIVNHPIGNTNTFPINTFTIVSEITFNIPTVLLPTDSVYYDGWILADFDANFNSYWGVSYYTNTFATPTDLIGSTTTTANALNYSNIQQIYLATNLIIPPTHLVPGGTITLRIYCNPTSNNHYLTLSPINQARIGYVSD